LACGGRTIADFLVCDFPSQFLLFIKDSGLISADITQLPISFFPAFLSTLSSKFFCSSLLTFFCSSFVTPFQYEDFDMLYFSLVICLEPITVPSFCTIPGVFIWHFLQELSNVDEF
jgi:hypothetical protein